MARNKKPWTKRDGKRWLFEVGLLCNFVAAILVLIAFVSPYWYVAWPRVFSGFRLIGLWEVCFAGMILEMDPTQKSYHGCWWIVAPEFYNVRSWLMPGWFVYTQVAVTLCLVADMISFVMAFVIWLRTGKTQRDPYKKTPRDPFKMIHVLCGITVGSAILMSCTVVVFGVFAETDLNWMPYPDFNYLSWSYGLAVCSAFFSIFASIAQTTYVMIIRQELREPPRDMAAAIVPTLWAKTVAASSSSSSSDQRYQQHGQSTAATSFGADPLPAKKPLGKSDDVIIFE